MKPFPFVSLCILLVWKFRGQKNLITESSFRFQVARISRFHCTIQGEVAGIRTSLDQNISESNQVSCHTLCSTQLERTLSAIPFQHFQRFSCVKEYLPNLNLCALCARLRAATWCTLLYIYLFVCSRTHIKMQKNALTTHTRWCM